MKKNIFLALAVFSMTFMSCRNNKDIVMPMPPGNPVGTYTSATIVNVKNPGSIETVFNPKQKDILYKINFKAAKRGFKPVILYYDKSNTKAPVDIIVQSYADFKQIPSLSVLDKQYYKITVDSVSTGQSSANVNVSVVNFSAIPFGNYIIPVVISIQGQNLVQFISIDKDGDYVPLSPEHQKPLPPNTDIKTPMKMIAYVETNDWDIRNYGQVILKDSKQPVFDIVVLFAANMNYDGVKQQRYIAFNDKLKPIVEHPEIYIKPLRDRGIKVIIDILPNHQGVGYRNFQSYDEALAFAKQAKELADKIGIDGWDMDEEYADYYKLSSKPTNSMSGQWFVKAMKEVMPDKLLTLYEFGFPNGDYSKYVDYSWANYGEDGSYYGIPDNRHAKRSIEANNGISWASTDAQYNIKYKTLGLMFFNINPHGFDNGSALGDLSAATQIFYGQDCVFSGKYYNGPKDNQ